jgi:HEAT repeat protein
MVYDKLMGREMGTRPMCPFCGLPVERPSERPGEMAVGACPCGAAYACDETGHSLGTAMIEALVFACGDWDAAWELQPDQDYMEARLEHYDLSSHQLIPRGVSGGRRISGVLYFVKLRKEDSAAALGRTGESMPEPVVPRAIHSTPSGQRKSLTKRDVEQLVSAYDLNEIEAAAHYDKKIIRFLQRLLYSGDVQMRKRAAEALGRTSSVVCETDPGVVARLLQGLYTSLLDTASSSWGAFDAIGEIIFQRPDLFAGYIPQLFQFLTDPKKRGETLEALSRIALVKPDLIRKITFHFIGLLQDPDPQVRGRAAHLLGLLKAHEAREDLSRLLEETDEVEIYANGVVLKQTVGHLASQALEKV